MKLPARISKYELEKYLGGGMSEVYLARDTVLGRTVAVKLLTPQAATNEDTRARFLLEARVSAGIAHEIGTPLGVVRGRAEYVKTKLGAESAHAPGLQVIIDQIDRVSRTLRQLLDFSRVKPGLVQRVQVAQACGAVKELLQLELERRPGLGLVTFVQLQTPRGPGAILGATSLR